MNDRELFAEFENTFRRWLAAQVGTGSTTEKSIDADIVEPVVTIEEFCSIHKISRSHYHEEKRAGRGPREIHSGNRILITASAVREWRQSGERAAISKAA